MNVNKAHQNIMKVIEEINLEKQLYDFDKAHRVNCSNLEDRSNLAHF